MNGMNTKVLESVVYYCLADSKCVHYRHASPVGIRFCLQPYQCTEIRLSPTYDRIPLRRTSRKSRCFYNSEVLSYRCRWKLLPTLGLPFLYCFITVIFFSKCIAFLFLFITFPFPLSCHYGHKRTHNNLCRWFILYLYGFCLFWVGMPMFIVHL